MMMMMIKVVLVLGTPTLPPIKFIGLLMELILCNLGVGTLYFLVVHTTTGNTIC